MWYSPFCLSNTCHSIVSPLFIPLRCLFWMMHNYSLLRLPVGETNKMHHWPFSDLALVAYLSPSLGELRHLQTNVLWCQFCWCYSPVVSNLNAKCKNPSFASGRNVDEKAEVDSNLWDALFWLTDLLRLVLVLVILYCYCFVSIKFGFRFFLLP